jgi:hypothetical protein
VITLAVVLAGGCSRCGDDQHADGAGLSHGKKKDEQQAIPVTRPPGPIYRQALERARKYITRDNASERLDEIERDIDNQND